MTSQSWTIKDVLEWAAGDFASRGIESPRLDAELLVAEALGIDRVGLYLDLNRPLLERERSAIRPLVMRRRAREPVAYILGHRDFFGRRYSVSPDVLIPRPDTETLVELALAQIPTDSPFRVLDVGTGSGAIAISIAAERPLASVTATDLSAPALEIARANAEAHHVADRIRFLHVDLVGGDERYDLVVSNPPYIASGELAALQAEVRDHEPISALEAGEDGLDVVRALLLAAAPVVPSGAQMLIEIGAEQGAAVSELAGDDAAWELVSIHPDLARRDRVVHLRRI